MLHWILTGLGVLGGLFVVGCATVSGRASVNVHGFELEAGSDGEGGVDVSATYGPVTVSADLAAKQATTQPNK